MHDVLYVILTEILMTPFIIFSVMFTTKNYSKLNTRSISTLFLILAMMSGMLNTINFYVLFPSGFLNQVSAINISMFEMSVFISYLLYSAFNGKLKVMNSSHAKWIAVLIGWNEISMAIFLYTLAFGFGKYSVYINVLNLFGSGITNYLFTIPMIIEMLSLLYLRLENPLSRRILIFIILMQSTDPGLFSGAYLIPLSLAFSVIMALALYAILTFVYNNREKLPDGWNREVKYFLYLIGISSIGLISTVFISGPFGFKWIIFAFSMAFSMVYYFLISFKFFDPSTQVERTNPDIEARMNETNDST